MCSWSGGTTYWDWSDDSDPGPCAQPVKNSNSPLIMATAWPETQV